MVQGAEHPPLYIVLLAGESWIGLHTYLEHQIFTCLMDTSTIVIIGYTARELFGKGAGIFAGGDRRDLPLLLVQRRRRSCPRARRS